MGHSFRVAFFYHQRYCFPVYDLQGMTAHCITLDSDWRSKEEVIKGITDNLLLASRCRYPRTLEADLWAREAVFSTGLGFSFAWE